IFFAFVGAVCASNAALPGPIIEIDTPLGKVKGIDYTTEKGCKVQVFESIPYAEPPKRFEL
ncbi:MAG: carboxylesterase family protein, partial [Gammaproteobacteria bacterium]|nr:carboxylesterase family protein [Gammaproteobacteria bacterium]